MNDPLVDPRCLVTADAVVIDGANGVCHAPRNGDWPGAAVLGFEVAVVLAVAAWVAGTARRGTPRASGSR